MVLSTYLVLPSHTPHGVFSIAGLVAARVCHDHFEDVVIVEPETWLSSQDAKRTDAWNQENKRTRIMQYGSFHCESHPS